MFTLVRNSLFFIKIMTNAQRLKLLTESKKTVFTNKDLQNLWGTNINLTKILAARMVKVGLLLRIARGYYSLDKDYNIYELANNIVSPSYVSFNSALFYAGVCFQVSQAISSVAPYNYEKKINSKIYKYYTMKDSLFFNLTGIDYKKGVAIAKPERAILDCFYFNQEVTIDNKDQLNFTFLKELSLIYPKTVQKKAEIFLAKH